MDLARIQRKRATDEVYEAMRQAIISRVFKPGERLQVDEIAQKLGVSLTPVRHALQQLSTEGLIEIHARSGTYVSSVSAQDIEETFEIRCALECLAGERAIRRIDAAQLERLKELLQELEKPVSNDGDLKAHEHANSEFHQILMDAAASRRLAELYESLNAHIKIARVHATEGAAPTEHNWAERLQEEQREHRAIVDAIEKKDSAALVAALRKHIYRAKDDLVNSLKAAEAER